MNTFRWENEKKSGETYDERINHYFIAEKEKGNLEDRFQQICVDGVVAAVGNRFSGIHLSLV